RDTDRGLPRSCAGAGRRPRSAPGGCRGARPAARAGLRALRGGGRSGACGQYKISTNRVRTSAKIFASSPKGGEAAEPKARRERGPAVTTDPLPDPVSATRGEGKRLQRSRGIDLAVKGREIISAVVGAAGGA